MKSSDTEGSLIYSDLLTKQDVKLHQTSSHVHFIAPDCTHQVVNSPAAFVENTQITPSSVPSVPRLLVCQPLPHWTWISAFSPVPLPPIFWI